MNVKRRQAKVLTIIFAVVMLICILPGCSQQPSTTLQLNTWSDDVKTAVNDFVTLYGNTSKLYDKESYVVFDFDNTTCIFDIQDQALVYQLENMNFAKDPDSFDKILRAELDGNFDDWITDIITAYDYLYKTYGPFTAKGLDEQTREAVLEDPMWGEFASKMLIISSDAANYRDNWKIRWFSGMTEQEIYDITYASCSKYSKMETENQTIEGPLSLTSLVGPKSVTVTNGLAVTDNTVELWKVLDENGIDVWVCSASEINQVRAAVDCLGLRDYCTGVTAKTMKFDNNGLMLPEYDFETGKGWLCKEDGVWEKDIYNAKGSCREEGKVITINNAIAPHYGNKGPLAGFMDSTGDFNFCTEYDSLKLVICFNRANQKITDGGGLIAEIAMYEKDNLKYNLKKANDAGDTYYVLQGRDDNNLRGFRNSNSTLTLGETEGKLFRNEDNYAQLQYITDKNMSIEDAINTFAIKTSENESDNVLGLKYGFLTEYSGYHAIAK
ncbi:MAG: hypothetical protein ABFD04_03585 [Syntrophomonas sp.]